MAKAKQVQSKQSYTSSNVQISQDAAAAPTIRGDPRSGRFIYTRFSSDMQRESSNADQERKTRERLGQLGIDCLNVCVISDSAMSGQSADRPGFTYLMDLIDRGQVEWLAVDELSRLTRWMNPRQIIQDLTARGKRFVSASEGIDTDQPGWELFVDVLGIHHNASSRETGKRVKRGQEGRFLASQGSLGTEVYGYESVFEDADWAEQLAQRKSPPKIEILVPDEVKVVHWIYQAYIEEGRSPREIAAILNRNGTTPPRRSRGSWTKNMIQRMLRSRQYLGERRRNVTETRRDGSGRTKRVRNAPDKWLTKIEPSLKIIDQRIWEKSQAMRKKRSSHVHKPLKPGESPVHPRHSYPTHNLGGLATCGECGRALTQKQCVQKSGKNKKPIKYKYLFCKNASVGLCKNKGLFRLDFLLSTISKLIGDLAKMSPSWFDEVTQAVNQEWKTLTNEAPGKQVSIRKEITNLDTRIQNLVDQVEAGSTGPTIAKRLDVLEQEREIAASRLAEIDLVAKPQVSLGAEEICTYLNDLSPMIFNPDRGTAKALKQLVRRFSVTKGNRQSLGKKTVVVEIEVDPVAVASCGNGDFVPLGLSAAPMVTKDATTFTYDATPLTRTESLGATMTLMRDKGVPWKDIATSLGASVNNLQAIWAHYQKCLAS